MLSHVAVCKQRNAALMGTALEEKEESLSQRMKYFL